MSWVLGLALIATSARAYRPNIVVIVADDLGWNDVGFHGSSQIPTPNIDALAYNGIILNSHYVQPMCTPSRAALMTGYYPIHTGMQGWPIQAAEPNGLPLRLKLLPQYLKELGYRTHAVGKWHLGYFRKDYTPLYRGFESHVGMYNGYTSYYDYILQEVYDGREYNGFDLRVNGTPAYKLSGRYATDLLTESAVDVITKHNSAEPMFLYLAHIAVHAGNRGKRLEAPQEVVNKFQYISDPHRRTYAAMVSKVDESVGRVVAALHDRGMLSNTIILFLSDNGAPSTDNLKPKLNIYSNWGSNYPLRGTKETLWEGGVRSASFIWSPELQARNRISNDLIHVTDWLPTLYTAAGGFAYALPPDLDGKDIWNTLRWGAAHPTTEVLLNINLKEPNAAMISNIYPGQETWKIVYGIFNNNSFDGYYNDVASTANPEYSYKAVLTSPAYKSLSKLYPITRSVPEMAALRQKATIKCTGVKLNPVVNCNKRPCLFNLARDPCETSDVSKEYSTITATLYNTLRRYRLGLVPQSNKPVNAFSANPALFNNTWSSWL